MNTALLAGRRAQAALATIDKLLEQVHAAKSGRPGRCQPASGLLGTAQTLRTQVERQESLAHITQAEQQAQGDSTPRWRSSKRRLKPTSTPTVTSEGKATPGAQTDHQDSPRRRTVRLVLTTYLETLDDVNAFLDRLRAELEDAIHKGERIQVR